MSQGKKSLQWVISQHLKQLLYVVHLLIHNRPDLSVFLQILQHLVVVTTHGMPLEIFRVSSASFRARDTQCKTVQTQQGLQTKSGQQDAQHRLACL